MVFDIFKKIIILDFIIAFGLVFFDVKYLINSQVAFFSSVMIYVATFLSYKNYVINNKNNINSELLDKIEDRFDLYEEDDNKDFSKIKNIKKESFKDIKKTLLSYISILRIFSYIVMVLGFFMLLNNKLLHIYSYFFGLFIFPVGIFLLKFTNKG